MVFTNVDNPGYPNRPTANEIGLHAFTKYRVTWTFTEECFVEHQNVFIGHVQTIN